MLGELKPKGPKDGGYTRTTYRFYRKLEGRKALSLRIEIITDRNQHGHHVLFPSSLSSCPPWRNKGVSRADVLLSSSWKSAGHWRARCDSFTLPVEVLVASRGIVGALSSRPSRPDATTGVPHLQENVPP